MILGFFNVKVCVFFLVFLFYSQGESFLFGIGCVEDIKLYLNCLMFYFFGICFLINFSKYVVKFLFQLNFGVGYNWKGLAFMILIIRMYFFFRG